MISIYLAIGAIVAAVMVWQAIKDRKSILEIIVLAAVSGLLWPIFVVLICMETYVIISIMEVVKRRRPRK